MALQTGTSYEFGPFRLEPAERRLLRNGQEVPLSPKTFEVLVALVCRAGHLVTKEELLSEVWRGTFVEEANLSYTVSLLRRALQSGADDERYIDTVQKLGYRFSGTVRTLPAGDRPLEPVAVLSGAPDGPVEPAPGFASSNVTGPEPWHRHRRWRLAVVAVAVLVLGLATIPFFRQRGQAVPPPGLLRFDVTLPAHITLTRFDQPAISPDGRRVAFTGLSGGTRQLWVRDLTGPPTYTVLPGTDGAMMPFWSPDSRRLAFYADRKLKTIDVDGGSVSTVCGGLRSPNIFWGAWVNGDVILFSNGPVFRVRRQGGTPQAITRVEPAERLHFVISVLSDRRRFLFGDMQFPQNVYVGSIDDPKEKRRLNIGSPASPIRGLIASGGYLVYAQKGAVVAQAFDERALEVRGPPITLAETDDTPWQPLPTASQTGIVVFRSTGDALRQLTWRDRNGTLERVVGKPAVDTQVELSPNGSQAIVVRGGPWPEDRDLWKVDLTTGNFSVLVARPGPDTDPAWSPDERRIAYTSSQDGLFSPVVRNLDTGKEENPIKAPWSLVIDDWTRGSLVLRGPKVFTLPVDGERKLQLLADTPYSEDQLKVSVDGGSIAFNADESDAWEVYVARFTENLPGKQKVSLHGGVQPRWRQDGLELFYLTPDGKMMVVERKGIDTLRFDAARELFKTPLNPVDPAWSEYDVAPDGQHFLILEPTAAAPQVFTFVLHWKDGQKN